MANLFFTYAPDAVVRAGIRSCRRAFLPLSGGFRDIMRSAVPVQDRLPIRVLFTTAKFPKEYRFVLPYRSDGYRSVVAVMNIHLITAGEDVCWLKFPLSCPGWHDLPTTASLGDIRPVFKAILCQDA